ncbi:MAG TPA: two-component regulator propeller domain-containing protein [Bacteroidia bacterium]|jgi:ligand-binding sensor domain-containing protein|nr:two-component regulator propeller domain-containing protein [Bacteroidia bacterium]
MMKVLHKLFFFLFILLPFFPFAQSLNFRNYTVDDGMPFVEVNAIFQDSKGNLWSGGYGGLSQFDGKTFTNYSPQNGLANHHVFAIAEDAASRLWVGTLTGISVLDKHGFKNYTTKDGLPDDKINCLFSDNLGTIWVGTDKGIALYGAGKFQIPTHLLDSVSPAIRCIIQDKKGEIWIGTDKGIVLCDVNRNRHSLFTRKNGLVDNRVNFIYQDQGGNYWIGTDKGLTRLDPDRKSTFTIPALSGLNIVSVVQDLQGVIWITSEVGLWRFDGSEVKNISLNKDVNANKTSCLYRDQEQNIWIGTHSGMFRFRSADFITYGQKDGLVSPHVSQLSRDRNGNLWVSTQDGGLNVYRDEHFYSYTQNDGLPSNNLYAAIEAHDGTMYIGTDRGYCTCAPVTKAGAKPVFRIPPKQQRLKSDTIDIIYQDSKGTIWFGQSNGVSCLKNGVVTWMPLSTDGKEMTVYYFMEDQQGDLWIGTYQGGLFKYNGKEFTAMNKTLGMNGETYLAILQDKEGIFYFGTFEGVYMYDPAKRYDKANALVRFSETDGLSSDLVYLMAFDDEEESIWIGTNQALNKLDLGEFKHRHKKRIVHYGKEEGFNGVECNGSAVCREPDGSTWFGTVNGLIHYNPREYRANTVLAKTNITHIRLSYADTLLNQPAELAHNFNNLSFSYIGICLTNPDKVRYKSKLEGFDKEWSPVTPSTIATYSNLPPGNYTFRVLSCNNENKWNTVPASFPFTILAPFWKRWWFTTILSLALAGITALLIRYRIQRIKTDEQLKARVAKHELKALRSQMNPHFIFNSLNSIQHFIIHHDETSASKYLNTFAKLIRTILNNSEKATATIGEEIDSLRLYLQLESLRFENKFEYEIILDPELDLEYHEIPTMLIQPYAENAILHGLLPKRSGGKLEIKVAQIENRIVCSITDNGIGRKKAMEQKEASLRKTHKSFGMKITQDRLELLNFLNKSSLNVRITDLYEPTGEAAGTRVEIYIPLS